MDFVKVQLGRLIWTVRLHGIQGELVTGYRIDMVGSRGWRRKVDFWTGDLRQLLCLGSVLGLLQLAIYINNLNENVQGMISL